MWEELPPPPTPDPPPSDLLPKMPSDTDHLPEPPSQSYRPSHAEFSSHRNSEIYVYCFLSREGWGALSHGNR